jgi:hypothetical protein
MPFIMAEDGIGYRFACPKVAGEVGSQLTVAAHIAFGKLDIDIMEQTGQAPLRLIPTQAPGQSTHDSLRSQHVFYQVFVVYVFSDRLKRFLAVHLPLLVVNIQHIESTINSTLLLSTLIEFEFAPQRAEQVHY